LNTETGIYDAAILGSGPGGYVAAIRGSQLGLKIALIEKYGKLGGTCMHWGCIPTKALLLNAQLYQRILKGKEFGILYKDLSLDFHLVQARKNRVVKKLSMGIEFLMKKNKIDTFHGVGKLKDPGTVQIEGENVTEIHAKNILIATGSIPKMLPGLEADGRSILSHKEILELEAVPKSLLIIGAGAVGIEFASIFSDFGSDVTVVEMLPRILPFEDAEISEEIQRLLTRRRIKFLTNSKLQEIKSDGEAVYARISDAKGETRDIKAEKALIAVGNSPATGGIGLEKLHMALSHGFIVTDKNMQTNIPGVYAIGDVVPTKALAHLASREGKLAMEFIADGRGEPINYDLVPNCTYCRPEVASVGLTEMEAEEREMDVATSKFPFAAASKATVLGENEGFVKLVADKKSGLLVGIHMIGPQVTELITEGTALIGLKATAADVSHLIHPHPTVSEGIMEAAHALYNGAAINI